jgi:hypothetical protein
MITGRPPALSPHLTRATAPRSSRRGGGRLAQVGANERRERGGVASTFSRTMQLVERAL